MGYFNDSTRAFAGVSIFECLVLFALAAWVLVMIVSLASTFWVAIFTPLAPGPGVG